MASFAVGDAVDCLAAAGAAWAPYRVARVRPDRRVDLFSADGGARLHRVDPRRLRRRGTAAATTTDAPRARGPAAADATTPAAEASRGDASPRAAGRRVAVAFHGGRRRCGEVLRRGRRDERRHVVAAGAAPNARARYEVGAEGPLRFDVAYDEGGVERGVAGDRVRPLSPADDTAAAVDDAGAGTLPAETLRARWRRRRDDAAADPAPAADDARPWPRFARCAVLLDGEWRRGATRRPAGPRSARSAARAARRRPRARGPPPRRRGAGASARAGSRPAASPRRRRPPPRPCRPPARAAARGRRRRRARRRPRRTRRRSGGGPRRRLRTARAHSARRRPRRRGASRRGGRAGAPRRSGAGRRGTRRRRGGPRRAGTRRPATPRRRASSRRRRPARAPAARPSSSRRRSRASGGAAGRRGGAARRRPRRRGPRGGRAGRAPRGRAPRPRRRPRGSPRRRPRRRKPSPPGGFGLRAAPCPALSPRLGHRGSRFTVVASQRVMKPRYLRYLTLHISIVPLDETY